MQTIEISNISTQIQKILNQGENCILTEKGVPVAEIINLKSNKKSFKKFEKIKLSKDISIQHYLDIEREH